MEANPNLKQDSISVVPDVPKKKSNGMLYGLIFAIILALGGIGFGVWAMMDGNARVETARKNCASVSSDTSTNCDIPNNAEVDNNGTIETIVEYNPDYIYIEPWSIKIKRPENWKTAIKKYEYNNWKQASPDLMIEEYSELDNAVLSISYSTSEALSGEGCGHFAYTSDVCFDLRGGDALSVMFGNVSDEFKTFYSNRDNYVAY